MEWIEIFFGAILRFFYNIIGNYGISIILFTLLVKLCLFPLDLKQRKSTMRMQKAQPLLNNLQKKYANDRDKLNVEIMKVYKQYKISPTSGCLPMLIQLPIILALYWVIRQPITYMMGLGEISEQATLIVNFTEWAQSNKGALSSGLLDALQDGLSSRDFSQYQIEIAQLVYDHDSLLNFVGETAKANGLGSIASMGGNTIDFNFLGLNLSQMPKFGVLWSVLKGNFAELTGHDFALWLIPIGSGLSSWISSKISQGKAQSKAEKNRVIPENEKVPENNQQSTMKTMTIMMPLISAWFCFSFPAALGLYWIISNVIQLISVLVVNKLVMPKIEKELMGTAAESGNTKMFKGEVINVKENRKNRKKR